MTHSGARITGKPSGLAETAKIETDSALIAHASAAAEEGHEAKKAALKRVTGPWHPLQSRSPPPADSFRPRPPEIPQKSFFSFLDFGAEQREALTEANKKAALIQAAKSSEEQKNALQEYLKQLSIADKHTGEASYPDLKADIHVQIRATEKALKDLKLADVPAAENPIARIYDRNASIHLDSLIELIDQPPGSLNSGRKSEIKQQFEKVSRQFTLASKELSSLPSGSPDRLLAQQEMNLRGYQSITCLLQLNNLRTGQFKFEMHPLLSF